MGDDTRVVITVKEPDGPARRGADAADELRRELEKLSAEPEGSRPQTRMIDPVAIGQIVVTLAGVAGGLGGVIETVQGWLQGRPAHRTVRMEIDGDVLEVSGIAGKEQQALIDRRMERHSQPG